jgi:hypothetical protein
MENSILNNMYDMLKLDLKTLKQAFELPRIYLTHHFDDLRRKVNIGFLLKEQVIKDFEKKVLLEKDRIHLTNVINSFEQDCLRKQKVNAFNYEITTKTAKRIKFIEKKLEDLYRYRISEKIFPEEDDVSYEDFDYINSLIYDEKTNIEKIIFLNKTLLYLDINEIKTEKDNSSYFDNSESESDASNSDGLIELDDSEILVGMILFIENDYIGEKGIEYLKK